MPCAGWRQTTVQSVNRMYPANYIQSLKIRSSNSVESEVPQGSVIRAVTAYQGGPSLPLPFFLAMSPVFTSTHHEMAGTQQQKTPKCLSNLNASHSSTKNDEMKLLLVSSNLFSPGHKCLPPILLTSKSSPLFYATNIWVLQSAPIILLDFEILESQNVTSPILISRSIAQQTQTSNSY